MECPDFKTYALPNIFSAWLQAPEETLHLSRIVAKKYCFGDLRLVALRERTRIDLLSQRELQIGRDFGRGLSYKQIAKDRQISPATVRHHLRAIYLKLGVTDKAELTSLMDESEPLLDVNALIERYHLLASRAGCATWLSWLLPILAPREQRRRRAHEAFPEPFLLASGLDSIRKPAAFREFSGDHS